jgi:hypothetical protein
MSPRVTLSVPDYLYEKIEKWKASFNLSKIFQKAISEEIEKKEGFQKRLKEISSMETVIARLKKEKEKDSIKYYEKGKKDGLEWAMASSLSEIQYALNHKPFEEKDEKFSSYDPIKDEKLGEYFQELMRDDPFMKFEKNNHGKFIPNLYFIKWESGWKDGIVEFWQEIKNQI